MNEGTTPTLTTRVEWLSRHLVPLTAMLYASGFVVAAMHFQRCGVPANALSQAQFLAAGLLAFVVSALSIACGVELRSYWASPGYMPARKYIWYGASQTVLGVLFFGIGLGLLLWRLDIPAVPVLVYMASYAGMFAALGPRVLRLQSGRDLVWAFTTGVAALGIFATSVFPVLPRWVGGGRGIPVDLVFKDEGGRAAAAIAAARQGSDPGCTEVVEIFSNDKTLYLEVRDYPRVEGACTPPQPWFSLGMVLHRPKATHVAIDRDQMLAVRISAGIAGAGSPPSVPAPDAATKAPAP